MSRTYKRGPQHQWCYRGPRGYKNAVINGARPRSIPPDSYQDISFDGQCYAYWRVLRHLIESGMDVDEAIHKVVKKFKVSFPRAIDAARWHVDWLERFGRRG